MAADDRLLLSSQVMFNDYFSISYRIIAIQKLNAQQAINQVLFCKQAHLSSHFSHRLILPSNFNLLVSWLIHLAYRRNGARLFKLNIHFQHLNIRVALLNL